VGSAAKIEALRGYGAQDDQTFVYSTEDALSGVGGRGSSRYGCMLQYRFKPYYPNTYAFASSPWVTNGFAFAHTDSSAHIYGHVNGCANSIANHYTNTNALANRNTHTDECHSFFTVWPILGVQ
jgi:hypothetical protein